MTTTGNLPKRLFGKTGVQVPIMGLGTGPSGMGLDDEKAYELYHWAVKQGITYIDTAPGYDRAHIQLQPILKDHRNEIFLASKAFAATEADIRENLDEGLKTLGVEYLDLFYLHSMGQQELEEITADNGALAGLFKAKEEGLVKNVGFTAHNRPSQCADVIKRYPFDAVMLAMNIADRFTYGFEQKVLPIAEKLGIGIAAMKAFGGAADMKYDTPIQSCFGAHGYTRFDLALRYCATLPAVSTVVVGVYSIEELKKNIEWIGKTEKLTAAENDVIATEGRRLSDALGAHFGDL